MNDPDIKLICKSVLSLYKSEKLKIVESDLEIVARKAYKEAIQNYTELSVPKICSEEIYINYWLTSTLDRYLATKLTEQNKSSSSFTKAVADFFCVLPKDKNWFDIRGDFFGHKTEDREKAWKDYNLPLKELERKFKTVCKERNKLAKDKGYKNFIDMKSADNKYNIPKHSFERFLNNVDNVIDFCNKQLPDLDNFPDNFYSVFGTSCYLCQITSFPFKTLDQTFLYVVGQSKLLAKFRNKIAVNLGEESKMSYRKESDNFEIFINKNQNIRHQSIDLIHELSHVINFLGDFKKDKYHLSKGEYLAEKEALITELPILKKLSPSIYQAEFGHILSIFHSILFQLELYKNPDQDISKLYAHVFNKCFKGAKQKTNPLYLLENEIILKPFSSLPHAIAYANFLLDLC